MKELKDKVAYITGGSQGIGQGIAAALLERGFRVAISGRTASKLEAAKKSLNAGDDRLISIVSDVRNGADERNAVKQVLDKWGRLDVLVANAGVGHYHNITELTEEQWDQTIGTNLTGMFHSVKAALDPIKKTKGYIINIASLAGIYFMPNGTAYNASKFGTVGFSQALMQDLRQDDVRVTAILPGSVATHFNNNIPGDKDAWKIQPEDIGQMVVNLLEMHPRTLPSKIEVRPSKPPAK